MDIDRVDKIGNTALHHAAATGKLTVCKYLLETQNAMKVQNKDGCMPIDLTADERCHDYLAIHMESAKTDRDSSMASTRKSGSKNPLTRISGFFKKKKGIEDPDSDFFAKMDELKREC